MSVIKIGKRKQNPFVQIERSILDNPKMSYMAKGLLAYLLSKPENWTVRVKDIENHGTEGKYTIRRVMKELAENGYLVKRPARNENGQLAGVEYIVYESPDREEVSPKADIAESGLYRRSVKQPLSKKDYSSKKDSVSKKDCCSKPKGQQQPISEEDFDKLREELRPELKATLKDGSKLYAKFIYMNQPARRGESSARRFFEYERPEIETERERKNRIAEEAAAFIDTVRRATGKKWIPNRQEAERLMREHEGASAQVG